MAEGSGRKSDEAWEARWDFLRAAGIATAVVALASLLAAGCGGAKIPDRLFAAGRIEEFPVSAAPRQVINTSIYVLHNEQGYAAISGECTNDGCAVEAVRGGEFACSCCGSQYALDGTVTAGPATQGLAWFEVLLVEGELQIDPTVEIPQGRYMPGSNQ